MDFWKGDIVKDAAKLNGIFKSDLGAVAFNDYTNYSESLRFFKNRESISEFRADLGASDDFGQLFKAYKKASLYHDFGKNVKMEDIFLYENADNKFHFQARWVENGWENGFTGYTKYFPKHNMLATVGNTPKIGIDSVGFNKDHFNIIQLFSTSGGINAHEAQMIFYGAT